MVRRQTRNSQDAHLFPGTSTETAATSVPMSVPTNEPSPDFIAKVVQVVQAAIAAEKSGTANLLSPTSVIASPQASLPAVE